jgi:DNA polymerase
MYLYLDTETYNETPISAGTYRYAETAEVMMIQWAVDEGPVQVWDHHDGTPPPDLPGFVRQYNPTVIAHKAEFDRTVLKLGNLHMDIPIERWECTMVQALSHALPGNLDMLGQVLGLSQDHRKLKEGKALINKFCKPAPRNHKTRRYTRETHPDEWARFVEYGKQDIVAMRECHRLMPRWNWQADDIALWHLDQHINERGFKVDLDLAEAGREAAVEEKQDITKRFGVLTGGLKPTQRAKVQALLNEQYHLDLVSTDKASMQPLADSATADPAVREIAQLMLAANKSSTAKYGRMLDVVSSDGRFRGGLQFAGAPRTRRWSGRDFQAQNLPSRGLPKVAQVDAYIEALKAGVHRGLFDDPMLYAKAALRGLVIA